MMSINMATQKDIIVEYLSAVDKWLPGYKLSGVETPFGFIGSQGDRRCRELENSGDIQRRLNGKYVEYKYKGQIAI